MPFTDEMRLRASKIMQERAEKNSKISFIWDSTVEEVYGDPKAGGVKGVKLKNLKTGKSEDFKIDGVFIAIGHEPNSKLSPANWISTLTAISSRMTARKPTSRGLCLRRCAGLRLPPGGHGGGHWLHGRDRCGKILESQAH